MLCCLSRASGYQMKAVNLSTNERKSISDGRNRLNEVDGTDGKRHVTDLEKKDTSTLLISGLNRAEPK